MTNKTFSKILIANRGEIACRIIRTTRRLGICSVAVFSEADAGALHVEIADEAVLIGPARSSESYLNGARIIQAARDTGADAIHPGYGFLSENPDFVEAVERAGLTFIGPSPKAIRAMGMKDAAKNLMAKAGIPIIPGYHGDVQEPAMLLCKAKELGFPVLIKARAGGGGKGMRKVDDEANFTEALAAAKREASASFGDHHVLVEKFIDTPRHIEVQVFGDTQGNAIYLFERDCSLQRRHQKVIEEAPAPGMTEEMRRTMGEAAVRAVKAIGYVGAGTIEFIVDASDGLKPDRFWFMEMNTRLQVEHPVTEMITGLDLVEWQLRTAAGEALPLRQEDLSINGHAVEARIYAEDPTKGFLPATGRIHYLALPEFFIRVDTGVRAGDEIKPFYDPMIAKIIAHAPTRATALARLHTALRQTEISGTTTNVAFLAALSTEPDFVEGKLDTGFLDRRLKDLIAPPPDSATATAVAAVIASGMTSFCRQDPFDALGLWVQWGRPQRTITLKHCGREIQCTITRQDKTVWSVVGIASITDALTLSIGSVSHDELFPVMIGERKMPVRCVHREGFITVFLGGVAYDFVIPAELNNPEEMAAGGNILVAPMPGIVKQVLAAADAEVSEGQALAIMEAMKMEMTLSSPRAGRIEEILVESGSQVDEGAVLIRLVELESVGVVDDPRS